MKFLDNIMSIFRCDNTDSEHIHVGDVFIGKLDNEYLNQTVTITNRMVYNDEDTLMFLHYYGFEKLTNQI